MDENDITEEIAAMLEGSAQFSDATITFGDDPNTVLIDTPLYGRFKVVVEPME